MKDVHKADRSAPAAVDDLSGTTVGRFAIRARLGVGMGEVYRAEDTKLKRPVALKRIAARFRHDEKYRRRFLREGEQASALNSEHVARVYDVFEENGEPFLVMEYVEGETLRQRLGQPMPVSSFLPLAVQCVEALVDAHAKDLVHRDIKPENIMLTPANQVKVLDFGVAKLLPRRRTEERTTDFLTTAPGALVGTPAYMSPEALFARDVDERTDIFSLGVVFYEALAGRHPFREETPAATDDRILHKDPPPVSQFNPGATPRHDRILAKMLAKKPGERYATARDLLVDLRALEAEPDSQSRDRPQPSPWPRRLRTAALVVVLVGLLAAASPTLRNLAESWLWPLPDEKNLVVLPFEPVGGGEQDRPYGDGLTHTLTAKLTRLTGSHDLHVTPAIEVQKRGVATAEEARREFGATLVLQGTLHRSANEIRVNCGLVDTASLAQLRTRTITADATDIFAVEDQVVDSVIGMLRLELEPEERTVLAARGTGEPTAHDFYTQGRGYLRDYENPSNIENAVSLFERALEHDPGYALAQAALGEAYWRKYQNTRERRWIDAAQQACDRSLELDAELAAAHICAGTLSNTTGRYDQAVTAFNRALAAEPTSDDAYRGLASAYQRLDRPAEAGQTYRRAVALRPGYWAGYSWLGAFYFQQGRYAEAAEQFQQVVALAPDNARGYSNLGVMYQMQGKTTEAVAAYQESMARRPNYRAASNLGTLYFYQLGDYPRAAEAFEQALALNDTDYTVWGNLGAARGWSGDRAGALQAYRRAVELGEAERELNPHDPVLLVDLAEYYASLDQQEKSLPLLRRALQLAPNDATVLYQAAVFHESRLQQRGEALRLLAQAVENGYSWEEIERTPVLRALRDDPRYARLRARHQSNP